MSAREEQSVTSVQEDRGRRDTHPAFGVAVVVRSSGSPRALFQSDLRHNETIRLSIHTADRMRDLNRDWVHPRRELIEVEMSLAQWGAVVSSVGLGSGVPVTIRRTETDVYVPEIPYEPRIAENVTETRDAVRKLLAHARETLAELEDAIESKKGIRATRDALRNHHFAVQNAEANAAFAVTSLTEAAESVVSQARSDIESQILQAQYVTGTEASIEAPTVDLREIEGTDGP